MHQDATSNLIHALINFFESKTNNVITLGVASFQVGAPMVVGNQSGEEFNLVFLFQCIGAVWISMQIIHHLYKFVVFIRSLIKNKEV